MPAMDQSLAVPSEVRVTRPTLTVPRRSHLYDYCPEERPGLRKRLQKRAQACGRCSRGRVWGTVKSRLPILDWLFKYNPRQAFLGDLIAGLTVGVMSIPQGMGYALMADLPPITGIYASIVSSLIYMFLGSSSHVSLGMVASMCMLTGKVVADLATLDAPPTANATDFYSTSTAPQSPEDFTTYHFSDYADLNITANPTYSPIQVASALAIIAGMWQVMMGVFQLGEVFTILLSEMVISGFTTSVAFHVLTSQAKNLLGITVPRYSGPFKAFYTYRDLFKNLLNANPAALVVSAICMVVLVVNNEVIKPKMRKVSRIPLPIELLVVGLGTLAGYLLNMKDNNNIAVIGHVPKGFPKPSMPLLELAPSMLLDAFLVALIGYTLAISMTKIIAKKKGYTIDPTQEMYAQGFINLFGSFFSCAPMSVSLSRSMVQEAAGGVTNITNFFTSGFLIAVLYSIGPLFESLPNCVLSCIILVALKGLFLQVHDLFRLWSSSRPDAVIWLVSCLMSMVVDLDYGLLAGVVTSLMVLLLRAQRPPTANLGHVPSTDLYLDLDRYHKAVAVPGVKIFQFGGPLHFGNAPYFRSSLFSTTGLDLDALKATNTSSPKTEEPPTDASLYKVEKEMVVVIIGPELKTTPPSKSDAPKDYDSQEDVGIYGSNKDMSEGGSNRDDSDHDDVSHYDTDMTVVDAVNTFPSCSRLTDTEGTLVANSGAAKESTCITLPVPRWLVLDFTLVSQRLGGRRRPEAAAPRPPDRRGQAVPRLSLRQGTASP
ncbi:sulfate anion transporter 1-like [Eriocheir sinensis]|uniref:sulfate anion transporter 1-like n=1 Tax=Eriocheir sinensis TaxID=95602 RepID=UPI0021C8E8AC|nr:sulfate anion transporter 1-like [Eriocheir sinensis]